MVKLLTIVAAILAIATAAVEKQRVPVHKILGRRDPFPESTLPTPPTPLNISLETVTQRVDNFDPTNGDVWEQRYYVNNGYYTPGSPIFLFLGGEWIITDYRLTYSLMHDMVSEHNGSIYYLEHRFYGESRPTPDVTTANLRFLTPEQALADTAHFINHIQSTVPGASESPVVLVGGHYSASLAVWFRQRYPHLAIGVWASSPPLPSIVDFDQFKVATGFAYRTVGGDACYNSIEIGFSRIADMITAGQLAEVTEIFHLCDPLEAEDYPHFFSIMAEIYAIMPQFETEEYLRDICTYVTQQEGSVESIAFILDQFIDIVGGQCVDIDYDAIIEAERETSWNSSAVIVGYRQWTYQLCSQIGWFHTSGSPDQPFGNTFPVGRYHDGCAAVFGDTFTPERLQRNSDRFNAIYGGLEPDVTNVVFVYGQHDPWSVIGRRTDLNEDAISIVIPRATMSRDLAQRSRDDPEDLAAAKNRIEEIILGWIAEAN